MVAIPDLSKANRPIRVMTPAMQADVEDGLKRALMAFFGASAVVASLGLWFVHSTYGDIEMLLVKFVFSAVLLLAGMLMLRGLSDEVISEIQIDPQERALRIVSSSKKGAAQLLASHSIDDLSQVVLRDGLLTARDQSGAQIVSVELDGVQAERAVREALRDLL